MKKMNSAKQTFARCPFSNKRLRPVLGFINFWDVDEKRRGAGRKKV